MQAEFLQNVFGFTDEDFVLFFGIFGLHKVNHFDFIELVQAKQSARIASGGTGFTAEARSISREFERFFNVDNFIAIEIGDRHFGGRHGIESVDTDVIHIFREFRKLAGTGHGLGVTDKGRLDFGIAMFGGVQVEHELNERALKFCALTGVNRKAGTGNFSAAFEVDQLECFANIPVRLDRKIKGPFLPENADDRIIRFARTNRNGRARQIRDKQQSGRNFLVEGAHLFVKNCNAVTNLPDAFLGGFGFGFFSLFHESADIFRCGIALAFEFFAFGNSGAAFDIKRKQAVDIGFGFTVNERLFNGGWIFANEFNVEHGDYPLFKCRAPSSAMAMELSSPIFFSVLASIRLQASNTPFHAYLGSRSIICGIKRSPP